MSNRVWPEAEQAELTSDADSPTVSEDLPTKLAGDELMKHLITSFGKARELSSTPEASEVIARLEDSVTELARLERWDLPQRSLIQPMSAEPDSGDADLATQKKAWEPSVLHPAAPTAAVSACDASNVSIDGDPAEEPPNTLSILASAGLTMLVHSSIVAGVLSLQRASFVEFGSIPALNVCFCHLGLVRSAKHRRAPPYM